MRHGSIITASVILLMLSLQFASAQSLATAFHTVKQNVHSQSKEIIVQARDTLLAGFPVAAIPLYRSVIESALDNRDAINGVDVSSVGEYAYALALNGIYEGAVLEIDKYRLLGGTEFFIGEVLELMGRPTLANCFKGEEAPSWLSEKHLELRKRFAGSASLGKADPLRIYERANKSASTGELIYALVLYDELAKTFPEHPQFVLGESVFLERLGKKQSAAKLLEGAVTRMGEKNLDRQVVENHIASLKSTEDKATGPIKRFLGDINYMVYAGSSFAKETFSLDGRVGIHTSKNYSLSANIGIMSFQEQTSFSIGISAYKTFRVFMFGVGLSDRIYNETSMFTFSPSVGLSIPDPDGSGSYDIIASYQIPFQEGAASTFCLSFGRTFYFHPKKK